MSLHYVIHVGLCQVRHFDATEGRYDVAVDTVLIGHNGARLIARRWVLFEELFA